MENLPYSEVRAHLAETLKRLEAREEPICISRRGQPAGVLMSVAQYQRLVQPGEQDFWSAVQAWRQDYAAELAGESANDTWVDPWADVRDRSIDGGRPPLFAPDDTPPDASGPRHSEPR